MAQKDRIKTWRKNSHLTQVGMAARLDIPIRTIENWESGVNKCPEWAERLLIEKLKKIAQDYCEHSMKKYASEQKSDENGDRPRVSWAVIVKSGGDEFLIPYNDMDGAIAEYFQQAKNYPKEDIEIACVLLDRNNDWFLPKNQGYCATDHESIDLPEEDD